MGKLFSYRSLSLPDMIKSSRPWGFTLLVGLLTIISGTVVALTLSYSNALAGATANSQSENSFNPSAGQATTSTWQVRGNGGGGALVYAAISPHDPIRKRWS
jgi:hypothetical protein